VDFALDPADPSRGFVLTEDGTLHRIDLLRAEVAASATVAEPHSMDCHWSDPRPRLALAGDEVVLTDPRAGLLRRVSADTLEEVGSIAAKGMPHTLAIVGGSGASH
jgi:zinc transport system substrate-binding protein